MAPTITSLSPTAGPPAGGNNVTITGTGFDFVTTVRFGTVATTFTVDSTTRITAIAPPGAGTVPVTVITSPGGTSNSVPYTYAGVPSVSGVSPNQGPTTGGTTVTLTGTNLTGATAVTFGATAAVSFTVNSATQVTAVAPPGSGTVQVTVTTPAGTSNGVAYTYITVPALTTVTPSSGPAAGGTTVTLTGTNLTGTTAVTFGATAAASFTVNSATQVTAVAPPGSGTVQVTVTTPAGTSNGVAYTYIPVSAPTLTSVTPGSGPAAGGTTVTLTGTGLSSATSVRFGATAASFTGVSATQITAVAPPGAGTVQVTVITPGGTSNGVPYTYAATPSLNAVSPTQGPTTGGNTVTLTGTNLTNAAAVTFGATPAASFTVNSSTQITAIAPPGFAGAVNVTVTTPGGTATLPSAYFYRNIPALTAVSPSAGPLAGGNTITLTGADLLGTTAVRFGSTAASAFTVVSDTQITATAPPSAAGTVAVTVVTPGGISNAVSYTYLTAPTVTNLSPNQGPTTGGNTITVTGTNLAQTTTVLFGATPAAFTVISNTQIVATAPAGAAGPTNLTVTTPGGASPAAVYTRVPPPTI
ncbi:MULTISPECIES: IPT/TIG domain-containing protein [Nocardia]|uniref:beta strand repeat-containing protein n=1 Tax=Nocardia TaxID=1817 RepID=UPI001915C1C7|nr:MULTISPECIES: IPT/TIG domain-containing protein [Nocardia]